MNKFICFFLALIIAVLSIGCHSVIPVAEVLQLKQGDKLYTKANLWFEDANHINALNIQNGRILPVGSEIFNVTANDNTLRFDDKNGLNYTILLDSGLLMVSMREYIRNFITAEKPQQFLKDVNPKILPYVKRGEVIPGMTQQDVLFAYGYPPACRTPDLKNETWIYWIAPENTIRVIFRNEKVRNVLNPNK